MKIEKRYIVPIVEFIDKLNLKGRASLGRTKLKNLLLEEQETITSDQSEAISEYDGWTDKETGKYKTDIPDLNKALQDLLTQEAEFDFDSPFKKDFKEALEEYTEELSGLDADIYALLYEKLEEEK